MTELEKAAEEAVSKYDDESDPHRRGGFKDGFKAGAEWERNNGEARPVLNLLGKQKERIAELEKERDFYKSWADSMMKHNGSFWAKEVYEKTKKEKGYV